MATDGSTFIQGSGNGNSKAFDYVLTDTSAWLLRNLSGYGDALLGLVDSTGGELGNLIGTSLPRHRLDSTQKQFDISFLASKNKVDKVTLWIASNAALTYRVGIQSDLGGSPSGVWIPADQLGSFAYADVSLTNTALAATAFDYNLPRSTITIGTRYHLVVAPSASFEVTIPGPSATSFAEIETVGADPAAAFDHYLKDYNGAWSGPVSGEVAHAIVSGPSGDLVSQVLIPRFSYPVLDYGVWGESFRVPSARTITGIRPFLIRSGSGSPTPVKFQLLDSQNNSLWSDPVSYTPSGPGWASVSIPATNLTANTSYRLIAWSDNRDASNNWGILVSADSNPWGQVQVTWDGSDSYLTQAYNRPGWADRSEEARNGRPPWPLDYDLAAFTSSASDAVYLGDSKPFSFATASLVPWSPNGIPATSWSYFNGSTWEPLTVSSSYDFTPPADWAKTYVDGKLAYWVRVVSTAASATPVTIEKLTHIRTLQVATVAERGADYIPVAHSAGFEAYDAVPPTIDRSTITPIDGGNTIFEEQPLQVKAWDEGSGVNLSDVVFTLTDETTATSVEHEVLRQDAVSHWVTTDPIHLLTGHTYRVSVAALDYAGNAAFASQVQSPQGGFLAATVDLSHANTMAEVPSSICVIGSEVNPGTGMKTATCPIRVRLASSQVTFTGTRHGGLGFLDQDIDLQGARVLVTTGGETQVINPEWTQVSVPQPFRVNGPAGPIVVSLHELETIADTLNVLVPADAQSATVTMPPVDTAARAAACADVTSATRTCLPDPIWYQAHLMQEVTIIDSACIELIAMRLSPRCSDEDVRVFFPGALKISGDMIEATNDLLDELGAGTTSMLTWEPNPTSVPYLNYIWESPPEEFHLPMSSEDCCWQIFPGLDGVLFTWIIKGRVARATCGWFDNPRPEEDAPWSGWIANADPPAWLEGHGFHQTPGYASNYNNEDWTRHRTWNATWCGNNTFRDHGLSRVSLPGQWESGYQIQDYSNYEPDGEPNPEVLDHAWPWPYPEWPYYVRWWHQYRNT